MTPRERKAAKDSPMKAPSPKLKVTLHNLGEDGHVIEIFTFEVDSLSSVEAKAEARGVARRNGYKHFKIASMTPFLC